MTTEESSAATAIAGGRCAVLIVTAVDEIESTAAQLAAKLNLTVEIASSRAAALRLLGRRIYSVVVLDQGLAESDPDGADLIWKNSGHAIPLQISLALSGATRMERELRAALARRQREQSLATAAAAASIDIEVRNAVTGFLLESRLALSQNDLTPGIRTRLETLAGIASRLHQLLAEKRQVDDTGGGLHPGTT